MHRRLWVLPRMVLDLLLLVPLVGAGLSTGLPPIHADHPIVRAPFVWAETCPHCHVAMDEVFPPVEEVYGRRAAGDRHV